MLFEWDEHKNTINRQKHGISFELASRIFADPFLITTQDIYSQDEMRFLSIGSIDGVVVILVVHTYKDDNGAEINRLISARKLSKSEVRKYGYR
ncbi:hypothetical protein B0181_03315 [Moraxella caviae]|uniref:Protein of uncharacterized function (DUF497) n=1 Tax=Moraxella caviae TaxID=34060 RepID=A0A1T0A6I4_9GAMM|nr:BrnT family toxin [Moraxella caviae]OOR91345.1 hypothetical protein B0181_03315 [Moraxella caviae]STZ13955.1 Protein of uncharacterised function (DUF497) [Moraxella caviae]VEW13004.1 Protein of uncharacterised function (DUF497) [Moraxella caviae]